MTLRSLFIICAIIWPFQILADPVIVQSGEHANFSRLVAPLQGNNWTARQSGREVVITYTGFGDGFDTEQIYDLIPRDRIADVTASASALTLTIGCDCAVSARTERDLFIVVDVADTKADLETPSALLKLTERDQAEPGRALTSLPLEYRNEALFDGSSNLSWNMEALPQSDPTLITALQDRLSLELKTATNRGLLSRNTLLHAPAEHSVRQKTEAPTEPAERVKEPKEPAFLEQTKELANLRISTSRDLPRTFRDLSEILGDQGQVCLPDDAIDVRNWGDDRPFAMQIAELRANLFGEFDRVDHRVVKRLAQTYIYFGFGAEALDILRLLPNHGDEAGHLTTLAQIVDSGRIPSRNAFAGMTECGGETALWAILVAPVPPKGALPTPDQALRTLDALPRHLRVLLAPKLHGILLAYGNPSAAAKTLRSIERLSDELPAAAKVAQAKGNLENGKVDIGKDQLREVAQTNADQTPLALIALVDAKLREDQPIDPETAQLLEAFAKELRDGDLGPELRRVHILALAQSGQFDEAFGKHDSFQDPKSEMLGRQLLEKLIKQAGDIEFLDHALRRSTAEIARLPQQDLLALARRFLDLGFVVEAERAMAGLPPLPRQPRKQLLAAEISLALRKPFRARADLLELEGEAADRLRADAKRMSGLHDEAHAIYDALGATQEASDTAWLANDWRNLMPNESPVFGATAALPPTPAQLPDANGSLTRSATLIEQSVEVRATLQELLRDSDLQVESAEE